MAWAQWQVIMSHAYEMIAIQSMLVPWLGLQLHRRAVAMAEWCSSIIHMKELRTYRPSLMPAGLAVCVWRHIAHCLGL